jgi:glycosyltransferase involved in cell wall biosynthesis
VNVGVVHHLPTGGAVRVLANWMSRTSAEPVTLYTRDAAVHDFAGIGKAQLVERPLHHVDGMHDEVRRLITSPRDGHRFAAEIDAASHDVVFCFPSVFTQALDVLPFLRTPSLYYAPEPLRSAYEPPDLRALPDDWRGQITRRGLNPLEIRRKALDRRYIRSAPHVVTHSQFTRQTLRDVYGVDAAVVLLGVDCETFSPREYPREDFVLAVGALHPLKGHELVIEALGELMAPRPRLVVVGDRGHSAEDLTALASRCGVELEIRAGISFAELLGLYRTAAVVACGQIREPFGLTPLEAMACETPVVAVAEGGFRETIRDGEDGLLVERSPTAMAAAIARVRDDPELADRLGRTGRAKVLRDWTWERTARGFDAQLRQLVAAGPRR